MKKGKELAKRIGSAIFTVMFIFCVYVVATVLLTKDGEVPKLFGYGFLNVATGSMEPEIKTGSLLIIKECDPQTLREGDIICFYSRDPVIEGLPNTHRIHDITQENGVTVFTTKGDANPIPDKYRVYGEDIAGVVVKNYSGLQKVLTVVQSQYFFFFVLIVPICIVLFLEFNNIMKIVKSGKKEKNENNDSGEANNPEDKNGADTAEHDEEQSDPDKKA